MSAVHMAPVAARAGIAAGTVYRYFPAKADLVAALVAGIAEREIAALRSAADAAPGPLSALAATIGVFAARTLRARRLAFALLAEPVDAEIDAVRLGYRRRLIEEVQKRIATASRGSYLPDQDAALAASAVIGALVEGLVGTLSADTAGDAADERAAIQGLTLFCLRALGVMDARARGLVVQIALPSGNGAKL